MTDKKVKGGGQSEKKVKALIKDTAGSRYGSKDRGKVEDTHRPPQTDPPKKKGKGKG